MLNGKENLQFGIQCKSVLGTTSARKLTLLYKIQLQQSTLSMSHNLNPYSLNVQTRKSLGKTVFPMR